MKQLQIGLSDNHILNCSEKYNRSYHNKTNSTNSELFLQNLCNDFDGTTKEGGAVQHALRPLSGLYQIILGYANHKQPISNRSCLCKLKPASHSAAPIRTYKANETARCPALASTLCQSGPFMQNRSGGSSHTRPPIR